MRWAVASPALLLVTLGLVFGCRAGGDLDSEGLAPASTPTQGVLSRHDVQLYLAVRTKALQKIEDALDGVRVADASLVTRLGDTANAERTAASALGVPWSVYIWVRDEIARLLSEQRQQEDARVLAVELARTRKDLVWQLENVRDEASRQFLRAQVASLDAKLTTIERERKLSPEAARQLALLSDARADLATLQGRQDRIQRHLRELLAVARSAAATGIVTPTPTAVPQTRAR